MKKEREETENSMVELSEMTKAKEAMMWSYTKEIDRLGQKRITIIVILKNRELRNEKNFGTVRGKEMSEATLKTADRDSVNAIFHKVLSALRSILKPWED